MLFRLCCSVIGGPFPGAIAEHGIYHAGNIPCRAAGVRYRGADVHYDGGSFRHLPDVAGCVIGHSIVSRKPLQGPAVMLILLLAIPSTAFIEETYPTRDVMVVTTSVDIKADIHTVWKNVIAFPRLGKPTSLLFKTGIAYPISAQIYGHGVGAVRHCNFSTGSFVEPITVWREPTLLRFNVAKNPAPMKELSFWDINSPHLHDYFVSKRGQFKLTALPNGHTRLEGTTWYTHKIRPEFYWRLWSNYIVHKIHERVLEDIKQVSEREMKR